MIIAVAVICALAAIVMSWRQQRSVGAAIMSAVFGALSGLVIGFFLFLSLL